MEIQNSLAERLNQLAERADTGCLEVNKPPFSGVVYLQDGNIIDAELYGQKGKPALFGLLAWVAPTFIWHKNLAPYRHTVNLSVEDALAEWEREGVEGVEKVDAPLSEEDAEAEAQGVSLPLLKKYVVALRALNPTWRTPEYVLSNPVKLTYLVGRSDECDIRLDHPSLHPVHCGLMLEEGFLRIWDLGSHQKTHVNGALAQEAVLKPGDVIQMGDLEFKLEFRLRRASSGFLASQGPRSGSVLPPPAPSGGRISPSSGAITYDGVMKDGGPVTGKPKPTGFLKRMFRSKQESVSQRTKRLRNK